MPVQPGFARPSREPALTTPFLVAAAEQPTTQSDKPLLIEMSKFLEACALECDETTLVFSTFQENANFNARMLGRYRVLADRASLVAAYLQEGVEQKVGLADIPKLRIVTFAEDDDLAAEWSVIVLSSRYCAMLCAREVIDQPIPGRRFEFILTHDRGLVTRAAITLANRL
ncbi:DICT sensory domain-containing protein [Subtercola boreus]|nr:DICT sensory domain-containing protein [Subtercola boreus]